MIALAAQDDQKQIQVQEQESKEQVLMDDMNVIGSQKVQEVDENLDGDGEWGIEDEALVQEEDEQ